MENALRQLFSQNATLYIDSYGSFELGRLPDNISSHIMSLNILADESTSTVSIFSNSNL